MNLYKRDFLSGLTSQEEAILNTISQQKHNLDSTNIRRICSDKDLPEAVRHYYSLFPNHHIDIFQWDESAYLDQLNDTFHSLITDSNTGERQILHFINHTPAFHIIVSLIFTRRAFLNSFFNFGIGHQPRFHEIYLFPEFPLGTDMRADYLLVFNTSGGYEFIFVELESPNGNITKQDGSLGNAFTKGLRQIEDWKAWLESNFSTLTSYFERKTKYIGSLPREFYRYDSSRMHFVVVAGLRKDFSDKTYRLARIYRDQHKTQLLHYENLL